MPMSADLIAALARAYALTERAPADQPELREALQAAREALGDAESVTIAFEGGSLLVGGEPVGETPEEVVPFVDDLSAAGVSGFTLPGTDDWSAVEGFLGTLREGAGEGGDSAGGDRFESVAAALSLAFEVQGSSLRGLAGSIDDLFAGRAVPGEGGAIPLSEVGLMKIQLCDAVDGYLAADSGERADRAEEVRRISCELRQKGGIAGVAEAVAKLVAGAGPEAGDGEVIDFAQELTVPVVASQLALDLGSARDEERRRELVGIASRLGDEMAIAIAEALGETDDRFARRAYIDTMVALGDAGMKVVEQMVGDSRWFVVRNAVGILGEVGGEQAVSHLTTTLANEDARVRKETVLTLARIGGNDASMLVVGKLEDPDDDVRAAACRAVGVLKVDRALKPLLNLLKTEKNDEVVEQVLLALGQLGDPGSVPAIEKRATGGFFSRPAPDVRIAAYKALFTIGTPHAKAVLEKAADDTDPEVKETVRKILGMR